MYEKLKTVMDESSLWEGNRKESHAFLLSSSVYEITEDQKQELQKLGFALYDCLLGLSHIAVIAYDKKLNYHRAWTFVRRVFSTGVPKVYKPLQGMNPRHVPRLLKVDLMVNSDGEFKIAEIDGHNKHGLGYSTLGKRFREVISPDAKSMPGVVLMLAKEIKRLGYETLKLLYAYQERFYLPEFEVARQEFAKHGIDCVVVSEMDVVKGFISEGLLLDLPFLHRRESLYDTIVPAYRDGRVQFVIPPKPFLGAKGVLALLRNDGNNVQLESLLRSFIRSSSLELVRRYIPETLLVGKRAAGLDEVKARTLNKRYVLKESISSGMKGTVFSDDSDFDRILSRALGANMNWILQEEVISQRQSFQWLENDKSTPIRRYAPDWLMRVTVQYVNRQLADVIVTARRDKAVHGAKDCLQLGTIVV